MLTTKISKPNCCAICGHYLTTSEEYAGQCCLDPGHWQAGGLLASTDYTFMALLVTFSRSNGRIIDTKVTTTQLDFAR